MAKIMSVKKFLSKSLVAIAAILFLLCSPAAVFAANETNQSNQAINQPAVLVAPDPDYKINVYAQPDSRKRRISYGTGGDRVTVTKQVGSNEGLTWNYVKFDDSSTSSKEGWIREDYIALQSASFQSAALPSVAQSQTKSQNDQQSKQNGQQSKKNDQQSKQSDQQSKQSDQQSKQNDQQSKQDGQQSKQGSGYSKQNTFSDKQPKE